MKFDKHFIDYSQIPDKRKISLAGLTRQAVNHCQSTYSLHMKPEYVGLQ